MQVIADLKEHEAGVKTGDVARKHGIWETTIYNWRAKFGGMEFSDAKRLRSLEEESGKPCMRRAHQSGQSRAAAGTSIKKQL